MKAYAETKTNPMNRFACGKVQRLSNPFVDNELPSEAKLEIIRHISACANCQTLVQNAAWLKLRVRSAVHHVAVPAHLCRNLSRLIRSPAVN